jgi:hypothetical protein
MVSEPVEIRAALQLTCGNPFVLFHVKLFWRARIMNHSPIELRRIIGIVGLLSLSLIFAFSWWNLNNDPATQQADSDFIAFYSAGKIARELGADKIYDLDAQQAVQQETFGHAIERSEIKPFMHPPFIAPILMILGALPFLPALNVWAALMVTCLIISAYLLTASFSSLKRDDHFYLFAGLVLFLPCFISILNGQDTAILLLGGSLWILGASKQDERLCGLGLALTSIRPQLALLFACLYLFRGNTRWWILLGAGLLAAFSVLLIGYGGVTDFLHVLSVSANGSGYKTNEWAMVNLLGLLLRSFPFLSSETIHRVSWIGYVCGLIAVVWMGWKDRVIGVRQIGLVVILGIFLSPHLHFHDLALLLLPLCAVMRQLLTRYNTRQNFIVLLPTVSSLFLLSGFFSTATQTVFPYMFMAGLFTLLRMDKIFLKEMVSINAS